MSSTIPDSRSGEGAATRARCPSEVLRADYMRPHAMSPRELARRCGLPVGRIRRVLAGEPIDLEIAIRLAVVFRTTALYWVALQTEFDMDQERRIHEPGGLGVL
jgi:addiction module HigA family antidote